MFQRPPYIAFINNAADAAALQIILADGTVAPLDATNGIVEANSQLLTPLGNFFRSQLYGFVKNPGVAPVKKQMTYLLNTVPVAGQFYDLVIQKERIGFKDVEDSVSDRRSHRIFTNVGETKNSLIARFRDFINLRNSLDGGLVTATAAAATLTLVSTTPGADFQVYEGDSLAGQGTKTVTVANVAGVNSPDQMSRYYRPENNTIERPAGMGLRFPVAETTYVSYHWFNETQLQLGGRMVPNEFTAQTQEFILFVSNALTATITILDAVIASDDFAARQVKSNILLETPIPEEAP
jgi:hypothetical protein